MSITSAFAADWRKEITSFLNTFSFFAYSGFFDLTDASSLANANFASMSSALEYDDGKLLRFLDSVPSGTFSTRLYDH